MVQVMLTVANVAAAMGVCSHTVRARIKRGELEAHKFGSQWRIPMSALAAYGLETGGELTTILRDAQKTRRGAL